MRSLIAVICLLFFAQLSYAQGIEFFDGSWDEAVALAKKEEKAIFVDAYAVWCGPCKRMAATTFKETEVGEFMNSNFVNVKLDMEKDMGRKFGVKYPVSAYPTLYFIDEEGEVLHKSVGGKDAEKLLKTAAMALRNNDQSDKYVEEYEKGNRDYDLVLDYVKALNKVEKPSLKISNDYINSKPEITDEQYASFLFEAVTEADSRLFKLLTAKKDVLTKLKTKEVYNEKILSACDKTVSKAIQYESQGLLQEAQDLVKANLKSEHKLFVVESNMKYYKGLNEVDNYVKTVEHYTKKHISKNPKKLLKLSQDIAKDMQRHDNAIDLSEKIAKKTTELDKKNPEYIVNYAQILMLNKKKEEALDQAKKAKDIVQESGKSTRKVDGLIKYIESK